jgi:hypothetical protein
MRTIILPHGTDLIESTASHLIANDCDYSSSLVIFPGKRPAHFLRVQIAQKIGGSFIPPVTFSADEFVDFIYEKFAILKRLEPIDAVALLYEIHQEAPIPMGGTGFMTLDRFFPLGMNIYHDLEEITIEGVLSSQIQGMETLLAEKIPQYTTERVASLVYFYDAFYKKIDALGFSTRSQRYQFAAKQIDQAGLQSYNRIIFAGFFAPTIAEKIIFQKLFAYENTLFLFQQGVGLQEQLQKIGVVVPEPAVKISAEQNIHFYSSPDTHGQVLALGALLKKCQSDGDVLTKDSVIMLPTTDTLFPLLRHGLSDMDEEAYNVSMGYPLARTPIFGFLNNLMGLVMSMDGDKVYIPDYLKFILHPYTKNIYFQNNAEITRVLFHTIEEALLSQTTKTFTTLAAIEENTTLFQNAEQKLNDQNATQAQLQEHLKKIHNVSIGKFLSFQNISEFSENCINLLVFLFHQSTAKMHPLFHPFLESLITALTTLSRSAMRDLAFCDRARYFVFLRQYIATCHTPFSGTPIRGLQVLGSLETRNLTFRHLFVLDVNEDILPATHKEASLIPFRAREILGLPTYIDKDKRTAYYFDLLIHGAVDVHLFFIENDKTERSRFVEQLLWAKEKTDQTLDSRRAILPITYQVDLVSKNPVPIDKSSVVAAFLKEFTFSATALDTYLKCPLQFYYKYVFGLRQNALISGDIAGDEVGRFVHAVLGDYFLVRQNRPLDASDIDTAQMDRVIDALFAKQYGDDVSSGTLILYARQVKRHLHEFLVDYMAPLINEHHVVVLSCEEQINVSVNGFRLRGQIDKIERRNDKIIVIDYKTGAQTSRVAIDFKKLDIENRKSWPKAIGSLQLPFYILLYSEATKTSIQDMEALFLFLGRFKIGKEIEQALFGGESQDLIYAKLKTVILKLLAEITDVAVPFCPTEDLKGTCPGCDYQTICGTKWRGSKS